MAYQLELVEGDITTRPVEAIVNAANTNLILGAGVAGAIKRKGGEEIQAECQRLAPIALGEVAVTGAGKMPYRYILHAATMHPGGTTTKEIVMRCTQKVIEIAENLSLKSLALPALGCGVAGLSLAEGAKVIWSSLKQLQTKSQSLQKVEFVIYGKSDYELVQDIVKKID